MAIDTRVPDIPANLLAAELPLGTANLIPRITGFLITFWIVGSYWVVHRRIDKRLDSRLIRGISLRNLVSPAVFLASIPLFYFASTFAPFTASFIEYFWFLLVPFHSIIDRRHR